ARRRALLLPHKIPAHRVRTHDSVARLAGGRPTCRTLDGALQEIEQPHSDLSSPRKDGRRKRRSASAASDSITPVDRQPPSLTGYCWLLLAGTKRRPALLRPPA